MIEGTTSFLVEMESVAFEIYSRENLHQTLQEV